jgi:uncharacterized integral membrane protein
VRDYAQWSKVVAAAVVITLLAVLVLENATVPAMVKVIAWRWVTNSAVVMLASFFAGVIVTLLVLFLRRGPGKQAGAKG